MNDTTFQGDGKVAYVPVVVNTNLTKQTNADRIRAMTDEELADFLWGIGSNPATGNYYLHGKLLFFSGNGNGWVDWLKQEIDYEAR